MADNLTNAEENRLLNLSLPAAGGVYLALFTAVGDDAGAGWVEVADSGYDRLQLKSTDATIGPKTGPSDAAALFGANADGVDYDVLGVGAFDSLAGGTLRWKRALTLAEQRTIALGDQYKVAQNALTFTLS